MDHMIESARSAFARYLENEYGRASADERLDDIMAGREDREEFIVGYVAALTDIADA